MIELYEMKKAFDNLTESALKLNEMYKRKIKENEELKKIINKAIELTENLLNTEDRGYYQLIFKEQLKVLRGEDKE